MIEEGDNVRLMVSDGNTLKTWLGVFVGGGLTTGSTVELELAGGAFLVVPAARVYTIETLTPSPNDRKAS